MSAVNRSYLVDVLTSVRDELYVFIDRAPRLASHLSIATTTLGAARLSVERSSDEAALHLARDAFLAAYGAMIAVRRIEPATTATLDPEFHRTILALRDAADLMSSTLHRRPRRFDSHLKLLPPGT